jgi:hypothetical protein
MTFETDLTADTFPLVLGQSSRGGASAWTLFVRDRQAHSSLITHHSRLLQALYFEPVADRGLTYRQRIYHGLTEIGEFARAVIDAGGLVLPTVAFPTDAKRIARELVESSLRFDLPRVGWYDRPTGRAIITQSDTIIQSFVPGDRVQFPAVTRIERGRVGSIPARSREIPARAGSVVRFEALDVVSATEKRQRYTVQLDGGPSTVASDVELERVAAFLVTEIAPIGGGEVPA